MSSRRYGINANDIKKGGTEMSKVATNQIEKPVEQTKIKATSDKVSTSLYLDKTTMSKVEMILKLKSLKSDKNISVSQIVNDYLEEYLEKNKDILNGFNF